MDLQRAIVLLQGVVLEKALGGRVSASEKKALEEAFGSVALVIGGLGFLDIEGSKQFLDEVIKSTDTDRRAVGLRAFLGFLS